MKQSVLDNMERIVEHMKETGWVEKSRMLGVISSEKTPFLDALSQAFLDLAVESFNVAEAKYIGYAKLVDNRDRTDMLDSILKEHTQLIGEAETKRKDVEVRISELLFLLEDFRDRLLEMGNLLQVLPTKDTDKSTKQKDCA